MLLAERAAHRAYQVRQLCLWLGASTVVAPLYAEGKTHPLEIGSEMHDNFAQTLRARVLVTGAGGFPGHHLTRHLVGRSCWVRGGDLEEPEFEPSAAHEFRRQA